MKKEYRKPFILFESFTLSTNIAAGCEFKVTGPTSGNCGYESTGSIVMFNASAEGSNCEYDYIKDYDNISIGGELFCYHNPTDDKNLFAS